MRLINSGSSTTVCIELNSNPMDYFFPPTRRFICEYNVGIKQRRLTALVRLSVF